MPAKLSYACGHPCDPAGTDPEELFLPCPICRTAPEIPSLRLDPPSQAETASLRPSATILEPPPLECLPGDQQITRELPRHGRPLAESSADHHTLSEFSLESTPRGGEVGARLPFAQVDVPPGYELLRELGRGGMSVVYQARRIADDQVVALKMIPGGSATTPREQAQFHRESQTLANLNHPNIVRVLEVGQVRGLPFFSMEYVAGGPLTDYLKNEPHLPDFAARLVVVLARAIQTAHDLGIVHRDLKPSNILVTGLNGPTPSDTARPEAYVKIADFGLAVNLAMEEERQRSGWIVGTPSYMAPEQAAGKMSLISPRTDIWGLGAILYECLTGRPPFLGKTALETLRQVQEEDPLPIRRLQPGVPAALETICMKCLNKNPARRYQSAAELARDLERYLKRQEIHAQAPRYWERLVRWYLEHPSFRRTALVTLLALLAVLLATTCYSIGLQANQADLDLARMREENQAQALQSRQRELLEREWLLGQYRYAAHVQQAQRLWTQGDLHAMEHVLAPYRSGPERPLRDFACRYLEHLMTGRVHTHTGHKGDVYSLAWSPDGATLVSAGMDGSLRFWNVEGEAKSPVAAHASEINVVAYSPDGHTVATGSDDGRIGLWNAHTGDLQAYLPPRGSPVVSLAFGVDGRTLYAGNHDGGLIQHRLSRVVESRELTRIEGRIEVLDLSPDGRYLALAGGPYQATLVELTETPRVTVIPLDRSKSIAVTFSPSGKQLAIGTTRGEVLLFDLPSGELVRRSSAQVDQIRTLAYTPDESLLISGSEDGHLRLWDPQTLTPLGILPGHAGRVWCLAMSPDGQWLASSGSKGLIKLRVPGNDPGYETLREGGPAIHALGTLPNLPIALFGTDTGVEFQPLTMDTRQNVQQLRYPSRILSLSISPRRDCMLVGRATELLDLHNFQTQKSKLLTRTYRYDLATAFTPDGRIAASGDARGQVKLWNMPEGTPLPCEISLDAPITALTFDPATDRLVLGTSDGRVNVWAMDGKSPLLSWEAHQHDVRRLAVSPVDNVLASAGRDHIVRLWNVKTGEELQRGLLGHHKPVVDAAFSVDGKNLATASLDGTVRIWSVSTGRELLMLTLPGPATGVSFLDANRLLVVGYEDQNLGFARIYPAVPE